MFRCDAYRHYHWKLIISGYLSLLAFIPTQAQKRYSYNTQAWVSYFNHLRVSNRWSLNIDGSLRTKDRFVRDFSQSLFRVGGTYQFNEQLRATAGYVYSEYYPNETHPLSKRVEHRPYQMVQWTAGSGRYRFLQVGRLEQRFRQRVENGVVTDRYSFVQRIRFASTVARSLSPSGFGAHRLSISTGLELFYNVGREVVNNGFDQLRASANLQYQLTDFNTINAGYLYQVQQFSKGDGYNKLNAIRISFIQQLDLRKNKI